MKKTEDQGEKIIHPKLSIKLGDLGSTARRTSWLQHLTTCLLAGPGVQMKKESSRFDYSALQELGGSGGVKTKRKKENILCEEKRNEQRCRVGKAQSMWSVWTPSIWLNHKRNAENT